MHTKIYITCVITPNAFTINFRDMNLVWRMERAAWKTLFLKISQFQNPCLTNTVLGWRQFAVSSEWPTESWKPRSQYQYDPACCCPNPWTIIPCDVTSDYNRSGDGSDRPIRHCHQLPERIQRGASQWP